MSKQNLELKEDYIKAIEDKLPLWFSLEVNNFYDSENWDGISRLFHDLRQSKVAEAIGMYVFNEAFGRLRAFWEDSEDRLTDPSCWVDECYNCLYMLQDFVIEEVLPIKSISQLKEILKALNEWDVSRKTKIKLKAIEEDFN